VEYDSASIGDIAGIAPRHDLARLVVAKGSAFRTGQEEWTRPVQCETLTYGIGVPAILSLE